MKVSELMQTPVYKCRADDTLHDAARVLWDHDCGCVVVVDDDGKARAVITDRDICISAYMQGRPLGELRVGPAMSKTLISCSPDDEVHKVEELMRRYQVRRVPIVDANERLVGIVSLNDIALHASRTRADKRKPVSDAEVGETLAKICEPRGRRALVQTRASAEAAA